MPLSEVARQLGRKSISYSQVGNEILEAVMKNKQEQFEIYRRGTPLATRFRQLEANAIRETLESLVLTKHRSAMHEEAYEVSNGGDIYHVHYVCDIAGFLLQRDATHREIRELLGSSLYAVIPKSRSHRRNSDNIIYNKYLETLRGRVAEKYKILLT